MKIKILAITTTMVFASFAFSFSPTLEAVSAESSISSRSLYNIHCASCHGRDGKANTPKGRETEADDITGGISTAKTIRVVTNGRGDMPSFKRKLSAAQISSIARYVAKL